MGEMTYEVEDGVGMMLDRRIRRQHHLPRRHAAGDDRPGRRAAPRGRAHGEPHAGARHRRGGKGSLEVGKDADLALFEDDLGPRCTVIGGRVVSGRWTRGAV
jgi:hypothetical protein